MKDDAVMPDDWLVIVPQRLPSDAAHLEYVHVIGFISQFNDQLKFLEIEILKGKIIVKRIRSQQLLTQDMHGVFRDLIGVAGGAFSRGQLNLRGECLLRAGGEDHGAVSIDTQFKAAEKTRVIMKEPCIGRSRRHNIAGDGSGKKSFPINQGKVVDLARLRVLVD